MQTFAPRHRRAFSASTALVGTLLLYWSVAALLSASHTPDTVPTIDAFLGGVNWIWLGGLGALLVLVGAISPILALARRSRPVAVALGTVGALSVGAWVGFAALSLDPVGGTVFFSPALVAGLLLLGASASGWRSANA